LPQPLKCTLTFEPSASTPSTLASYHPPAHTPAVLGHSKGRSTVRPCASQGPLSDHNSNELQAAGLKPTAALKLRGLHGGERAGGARRRVGGAP
jgi:hypothetical protein